MEEVRHVLRKHFRDLRLCSLIFLFNSTITHYNLPVLSRCLSLKFCVISAWIRLIRIEVTFYELLEVTQMSMCMTLMNGLLCLSTNLPPPNVYTPKYSLNESHKFSTPYIAEEFLYAWDNLEMNKKSWQILPVEAVTGLVAVQKQP